MKMWLSALIICCGQFLFAQEYFPKNDGVKSRNNNYTAFTNAKIYLTPDEVIENGTLLIQNGKVVAAGTNVEVPENSMTIDLTGKSVYPSFVDIFTDFGIDKPKRAERSNQPQYDASREGYYWNDHIMPEKNGVDHFSYDAKKAKSYLKSGFGVLNTHVPDGIMRGTGLVVSLNDEATNNERILNQESSQFLSFEKSVASNQSYPTSLMGAMALLRQVYHDAAWYAGGNAEVRDLSLEAVNANRNLPQIFDAGDKLNTLRAHKIADEFGINYILKGEGNEFERIEEVAATGAAYIIPIAFPDAYDVTDPAMAEKISLSDMRMWNQAPTNPAVLAGNGVPFTLTTSGLKNIDDFHSNLRKAIAYGLDETEALRALTTRPAELVGMGDQIGMLKPGYYANFIISSGDVFSENTTLFENWVQGKKHVINSMDVVDIRGDYDLKVNGSTYTLKITGKIESPKAEITKGETTYASKLDYKNDWINLFFDPEADDTAAFTRLSARITDPLGISGNGVSASGKSLNWSASRTAAFEDKASEKAMETMPVMPVTYPNRAYGNKELPKQQSYLFKNATVWTSEDAGILENTDVLVKNGKISAIGTDLSDSGAIVIDATGKHLTAGIIDEHSHIAAAAINEAGHNSSAEVTIEDVVDSEDSDIYRNLSGGVTSIQILHGSANPIGGRSAIIKLKWGESPEELIYENSPKFIKFALGENVKQSNWGSFATIRFPQTRMGVEQVFKDYFSRARAYHDEWETWNNMSRREKERNSKPRYDLEMETLAEILNKERFISCHSYVQSEINMLMKVAESFDFNVNTFTHILEGYKVADKMAEHGVGGSTFSDWWAYKYEVKDAIPYNAAIMHNQGVTVAINSDDAEMSRRLNQEAAKTVKYGDMSEEEAWKFVTINPAKLLHIDDRVGSIKEGKDADLVLWSDHPLSIYAVAEKTMIEGTVYYDYEEMQQRHEEVEKERNELVNMMISAKNKGMKTQAPEIKEEEEFHCNTLIYQK
nr:amidohydrolase family protein [Robertkochia sp. 3YJGBD-33]